MNREFSLLNWECSGSNREFGPVEQGMTMAGEAEGVVGLCPVLGQGVEGLGQIKRAQGLEAARARPIRGDFR